MLVPSYPLLAIAGGPVSQYKEHVFLQTRSRLTKRK